jgi:hypothetical protein
MNKGMVVGNVGAGRARDAFAAPRRAIGRGWLQLLREMHFALLPGHDDVVG